MERLRKHNQLTRFVVWLQCSVIVLSRVLIAVYDLNNLHTFEVQ
jgi:hypothetical protein